jgi:hypothetical protein
VLTQPPEEFFNQHLGKSHCFETTVALTRDRTQLLANRTSAVDEASARYPLTVTLHYLSEDFTAVATPDIMQMMEVPEIRFDDTTTLKVRINEVSKKRHSGRLFCLKIAISADLVGGTPSAQHSQWVTQVLPVYTTGVHVLSKPRRSVQLRPAPSAVAHTSLLRGAVLARSVRRTSADDLWKCRVEKRAAPRPAAGKGSKAKKRKGAAGTTTLTAAKRAKAHGWDGNIDAMLQWAEEAYKLVAFGPWACIEGSPNRSPGSEAGGGGTTSTEACVLVPPPPPSAAAAAAERRLPSSGARKRRSRAHENKATRRTILQRRAVDFPKASRIEAKLADSMVAKCLAATPDQMTQTCAGRDVGLQWLFDGLRVRRERSSYGKQVRSSFLLLYSPFLFLFCVLLLFTLLFFVYPLSQARDDLRHVRRVAAICSCVLRV